MDLDDDISITEGNLAFASEITKLVISAWKETYRQMVSTSYLESVDLSFKRRLLWTEKQLIDREHFRYYLAHSKKFGLVGMSCFSTLPHSLFEGYGELQAIYILQKHQGKKIGHNLLRCGFHLFKEKSISKAYCLVLEKNKKAQDFYLKEGAQKTDHKMMIDLGRPEIEIAMVWHKLDYNDGDKVEVV